MNNNQHMRLEVNDARPKILRRTSSLQLPLYKNLIFGGTFTNALSTIKSSTISIYASTVSAEGLLESETYRTESPTNLYLSMARYRCCCGTCRLRVGSLAIAIFSTIYPIIIILGLVFYGHLLNPLQQTYIKTPAYVFMGYQFVSSVLLIAGLLIDLHYLLIPFQLSLVFNVMGTMGFGIILMISTDRNDTHLFPIFAISLMLVVGVHLWFIIITCLTFVLIRDKSRLTGSELDIYQQKVTRKFTPDDLGIERVNSAMF